MTTRSDERYSVHRDQLLIALLILAGLRSSGGSKSIKLPADFSGEFKEVKLPARAKTLVAARGEGEGWNEFTDRVIGNPEVTIPGVYTVRVKASPTVDRRKSSEHRTFVVCPGCSREIPTGRLHQHMHTKSTCRPA